MSKCRDLKLYPKGKTKAMGKMVYFATEPKNIKMMLI